MIFNKSITGNHSSLHWILIFELFALGNLSQGQFSFFRDFEISKLVKLKGIKGTQNDKMMF